MRAPRPRTVARGRIELVFHGVRSAEVIQSDPDLHHLIKKAPVLTACEKAKLPIGTFHLWKDMEVHVFEKDTSSGPSDCGPKSFYELN